MSHIRYFLLLQVIAAKLSYGGDANSAGLPMVINTWGGAFTIATDAAWTVLQRSGSSAIDAVEIGCSACERNQCDGTVGYGGSPDEDCETTLDAMIMDGTTFNAGAVAGLRRVRDAISVARHVMEHTEHTLLSGDLATKFAEENDFIAENLTTADSAAQCDAWKADDCQPNFRMNISPDSSKRCGPYRPSTGSSGFLSETQAGSHASSFVSHDTISMIAIDTSGDMAAGTSTNGASHKVPGRVGDGPIIGSGSYVDSDIGGCGATGDGDIMMRFLPCYQAVENLRRGMNPTAAAEDVIMRMTGKFPDISAGIVVVDRRGNHGGAGTGWTFTYAFRSGGMNATEVVSVMPLPAMEAMELFHQP